MKGILAICAVIISFSAVHAFAESFRCPNGNIVSTGDSISIVDAKCDAPASKFTRLEPIETGIGRVDGKPGANIVYIEVQEWTYSKGSTLLHILKFRNGILSEVITDGFVQ